MPSRGKILVAEDTPPNIHLFRTVLTGAGFDVTIVETGPEAVDATMTGEFDLVLMDLGLPGMDGREACGRIRAAGGFASFTPVVALTADDDVQTRRSCEKVGMQGVLTKPISPSKLVEAASLMLDAVHEARGKTNPGKTNSGKTHSGQTTPGQTTPGQAKSA